MAPILNPAGVQELIDYGLYGYAMSRFSSTWTAMKCVKDNFESTASVDVSLDRLNIVLPELDLPPGGLHIRHEVDMLGQEARLHEYKRNAFAAFIRANGLNRIVFSGGPKAKLGIVTVGKSYLDVRQALDELGVDEARARELGIRLFKVACPWPLDYQHIEEFARGLETVVVVEEKRSLIETQLRARTFTAPSISRRSSARRTSGEMAVPAKGALDPNEIAIALGDRILKTIGPSETIGGPRCASFASIRRCLPTRRTLRSAPPISAPAARKTRRPRCPRARSQGRASAAISCRSGWTLHVGFTQMGGEGAQWVGQAPFSKRKHVFQNLGDGTYNHSGSLALRFALSSEANVTYKILFNDAVAMTGGQPRGRAHGRHDSRARCVPKAWSESRSSPTNRTSMPAWSSFPPTPRSITATTSISFSVNCATCRASRCCSTTRPARPRSAGAQARHVPGSGPPGLHQRTGLQGCGDCGVKSNCVSIQPVETEFGRKRRIDQSSCNKDFSCLNGFCPSFVTVHGGKIRKARGAAGSIDPMDGVPDVPLRDLSAGWASIIDGGGWNRRRHHRRDPRNGGASRGQGAAA